MSIDCMKGDAKCCMPLKHNIDATSILTSLLLDVEEPWKRMATIIVAQYGPKESFRELKQNGYN